MKTKTTITLILFVLIGVAPLFGQGIFSVYNNESEYKAAIGIQHRADDFSDLGLKAPIADLLRTCGPCGYLCHSYSNFLWKGSGEVTTGFPMDTLYLSNRERSVNYIGGYFYNTDESGQFVGGMVTIKAGGASYSFTPTDKVSFMGFVFSRPVDEISFSGGAVNLKDDYAFTMSHVYFGTPQPGISSLGENKHGE